MILILKNKYQINDKAHLYSHLGGSYSLLTEGNKAINEKSFSPKETLAFFGFTSCPDVCPLGMRQMRAAYNKLSNEQKEKIQILFISLDYKKDNPEKVNKYAKFFHEDFIGATSNEKGIRDMTNKYKVGFEYIKNKKGIETINHSGNFYHINKEGKILNILSPDELLDYLKKKL